MLFCPLRPRQRPPSTRLFLRSHHAFCSSGLSRLDPPPETPRSCHHISSPAGGNCYIESILFLAHSPSAARLPASLSVYPLQPRRLTTLGTPHATARPLLLPTYLAESSSVSSLTHRHHDNCRRAGCRLEKSGQQGLCRPRLAQGSRSLHKSDRTKRQGACFFHKQSPGLFFLPTPSCSFPRVLN